MAQHRSPSPSRSDNLSSSCISGFDVRTTAEEVDDSSSWNGALKRVKRANSIPRTHEEEMLLDPMSDANASGTVPAEPPGKDGFSSMDTLESSLEDQDISVSPPNLVDQISVAPAPAAPAASGSLCGIECQKPEVNDSTDHLLDSIPSGLIEGPSAEAHSTRYQNWAPTDGAGTHDFEYGTIIIIRDMS